MRIVTLEFYLVWQKRIERGIAALYGNTRELSWFPRKLLFDLLPMIFIHMKIAQGVDIFSRFPAQNLGYDHSEKCVACNIKWYAKKHIGTSLIELQTNFSL